MASALDFGSFSDAEKSALLTALKGEVLQRITGRVSTASSAGQSFGMAQMTMDEIKSAINGLTADLGLSNVETRARPDWSGASY